MFCKRNAEAQACTNDSVFSLFRVLCAILLAVTIITLLILKEDNYTQPWMFAIAIVITFAFSLFQMRSQKQLSKCFIFSLSVVLSLFQMLIVKSYLFETSWDVWTVLRAAEAEAYHTEWIPWFDEYFSTYPNNCLLTAFYSFLFRWIPTNQPIFLIACVNCSLSGLTSYFLYRTVCLVKDEISGLTVWILYWLILGLSPWISITYSDPLVLIFPIVCLYIFFLDEQEARKQQTAFSAHLHALRIFLTFFIAGIGYRIKPQTLIPAIAIFICFTFKNLLAHRLRREILDCLAAILGGGLSILICKHISNLQMMTLNAEAALQPTHWMMMGLNPFNKGRYWENDVLFSKSFLTSAERWNGNIEVIRERLSDFGFWGYAQFLGKKLEICMGDGTFYWAKNADSFFNVVFPYSGHLGSFTRAFYYTDGKFYQIFHNVSNVLWAFLISSSFVGLCFGIGNRKNQTYTVVYLSILGLIMFELIFEVFPRHLYSFAPVFIIAAEQGISGVTCCVRKYRKQKGKVCVNEATNFMDRDSLL